MKAPTPAGKGPVKKPAPKPSPVSAKKPAGPPPKRRRRDEEDDEDDRPRKRRRVEDDDDDEDDDDEKPMTAEDRRKDRLRDRRQRLTHVNLGLLLHTIKMWSSVVLLFAIILTAIFGVITGTMDAFARSPDQAEQKLWSISADSARETYRLLASVFAIFTYVCIIAAPLVGAVGSGFCLMIPKKSGANGTILTSFVFDVIPLVGLFLVLLGFLNVFGFEKEKNDRFMQYLLLGCGFFTMTALLLFMVFLRQLCLYMQKPLLGSDSLNLVMFFMIQIVTFPIVMIANGFAFKIGLSRRSALRSAAWASCSS